MDQAAGRAASATPLRTAAPMPAASMLSAGSDQPWLVLVMSGPNKSAVLPLGQGAFRLGAGLNNDIVLADAAMADEQAVLSIDASGARVAPLAAGLRVDARPVRVGRTVTVTDGTQILAGETVLQLRGPSLPRRRVGWLLLAVPLLLVGVGGAALVGIASPGHGGTARPHSVPASAGTTSLASEAVEVLRDRLRQVGLAEQVSLSASSGAVVANGQLPGPDLARWAEHQLWFDGRYKGSLSLISRVREAPQGEKPALQLSAVSTGRVPYLIAANGDRYGEGAVVDGWTIKQISPDKVVLSRNGRQVEMVL